VPTTGLGDGKYVVRATPAFLPQGGNVVTPDNGINNDNNGSQPGGPGTSLYSPVITSALALRLMMSDTNPDTTRRFWPLFTASNSVINCVH
jgi:hypothetical protein